MHNWDYMLKKEKETIWAWKKCERIGTHKMSALISCFIVNSFTNWQTGSTGSDAWEKGNMRWVQQLLHNCPDFLSDSIFCHRSGRWSPAEHQSCWVENTIIGVPGCRSMGNFQRRVHQKTELYGLGVQESHEDPLQCKIKIGLIVQ